MPDAASDTLAIDESRPELKGLNEFYQREIVPWMEERVDRHGKGKRHALIYGIAGALVLPLIIWGSWWLGDSTGITELVFVLPLLYAAGVAWFALRPLTKLKDEVKAFLLDKVCGFLGFQYKLQASGFPFETFMESGLLPSHHRRKLEDNISGRYNEVDFDLLEARLERRQSTGRQTSYVEVYHGILFQFAFQKNFDGRTLVTKESGKIGNFFKGIGRTGERIKLEDPRFEKMFEVWGTDQIEARYLLTPTFMERVVDLAKAFGEKSVELCFMDNKLLVSIRVAKDHFEGGGMFTSMTEKKRVEDLVEELCKTFDVIDTLKLSLQTRA